MLNNYKSQTPFVYSHNRYTSDIFPWVEKSTLLFFKIYLKLKYLNMKNYYICVSCTPISTFLNLLNIFYDNNSDKLKLKKIKLLLLLLLELHTFIFLCDTVIQHRHYENNLYSCF